MEKALCVASRNDAALGSARILGYFLSILILYNSKRILAGLYLTVDHIFVDIGVKGLDAHAHPAAGKLFEYVLKIGVDNIVYYHSRHELALIYHVHDSAVNRQLSAVIHYILGDYDAKRGQCGGASEHNASAVDLSLDISRAGLKYLYIFGVARLHCGNVENVCKGTAGCGEYACGVVQDLIYAAVVEQANVSDLY